MTGQICGGCGADMDAEECDLKKHEALIESIFSLPDARNAVKGGTN
jgi:hypothetical protein